MKSSGLGFKGMEGMSDWRQDESNVLCRACIESNLKTRMIVIVPVGTTVAEFKEKIRRCHIQNFPELGGVRVTKLMILVFGFWYTFNEGSIGVLSRGTDARFKVELEREEQLLENGRAEVERAENYLRPSVAAAVGGICGTCLKDVRRNCSSSQNNFDRIKSLEVSPPVAAVEVDAGLAVTSGAEDAREFVCRGARRQLSHAREEGGKGRDVEEEPILTGLTAVETTEKETPKTAEKVLDETPETAEKRKVVNVDEDPKVADESMPVEDDQTRDPAEKRRPIEDEAPKAAEPKRRLIEEESPEVAEKRRPAEDGETTKAAEKQKPAEDLETAKAAEKKSAEVVERAKAAEKKKPAEDVERAKAAEPVHDVEAAKAAETRQRFGDVETARTAENEKPVEDGKAAAVEDETLKTAESEDEAINYVRQKSVVSEPSMSEAVIDSASRKRKADPPQPDLPAKVARVDSASEDSSDSMDEESNQSAQVERGNGKKLDRETVQAKYAEKLEAQEELEELGAGSKQDNSEEVDKAVLDGGQDVKNDFTQRSVDSIIPPQDLCTSKNVDDVCNNLITQHFSDSSISNSAEASSASEDSGHQAPKAVVSKAAASKPAAKTRKLADSDSESSEDAPDPRKFFKVKGASQKSKVGLIVPNIVDSEEVHDNPWKHSKSSNSEQDEADQKEKKWDVVSKRSTEEPLKAKAVQAPAKNAAQVSNRQSPVLSSSSTEMSSDSESSSTDPSGSPAKGNPRRTGVDTRFQHFVDKNDGLEQLFNFKLNKRREVGNNTADVVYETQDIDGEVDKVVQKADESSKAKQKTQKGRKPKAVLETSQQTKQKAAKSKAVRDTSEQQNDFHTPVAKPATTPAATPATATPAPSTKTKRKPGEDVVPKTKTLKKPRQEAKSPPVVDGILAPKPLAVRKTKVPCPSCGKLYVGKSTSYLAHTKTCTGPVT